MQLYENIFLNTDKIIQGQTYTLVYRGKHFENVKRIKCPNQKIFINIGEEKIELIKKDYGYTCEIVFNENKNDIKIIAVDETKELKQIEEKEEAEKEEKFILYAITEPIHLNVLKNSNKNNLIRQKDKNFLSFPEQILNVINKAIKIFPKVLENRMNTKMTRKSGED